MQKALGKGYRVIEIDEVWHFKNIYQYDPMTKSGGIFTEYVITFLKVNQKGGWPEWCKSKLDNNRYIRK